MSCSRACVLSSPRALVLSCSHAFMLSGSPAVMPSCYRATKLSYRKESGNALLFCSLASRLVFSDSLPSSLFIPSERICSLSNSLPVLARTGFENRAPVEAGRPFLKIRFSQAEDVLKSSRRAPRTPNTQPRCTQSTYKSHFCFPI